MKPLKWIPAFTIAFALALGGLFFAHSSGSESPSRFSLPVESTQNRKPSQIQTKDEILVGNPIAFPEAIEETRTTSNQKRVNSILDLKADANQRFEELTTLIAQGPGVVRELGVIAAAPISNFALKGNPHSQDTIHDRFEKSLRVTAIEALDKLGTRGVDVREKLENVRDSHRDTELVFLANLALAGIAEGRPGKVSRFIDQVFNENVK